MIINKRWYSTKYKNYTTPIEDIHLRDIEVTHQQVIYGKHTLT